MHRTTIFVVSFRTSLNTGPHTMNVLVTTGGTSGKTPSSDTVDKNSTIAEADVVLWREACIS